MTHPTSPIASELRARRAESFDLYRRYVNPAFVDLIGLVGYGRRFVRSRGLELEDEGGRRYLDFLSGYGCLNIGHNHPTVKAALRDVLDLDVPGFTQIECSLPTGLAAERLAALMPPGLDKVFFCSSGSEAMEAALKLARAATGRKRVVGCEGAFHGTTLGVLGLMDNASRRDRVHPFVPGLVTVPFGDLEALEGALRWGDVAAFVVEPVLGEGGALPARVGYLAQAQALCRKHGALLVVDEVQTGLGRTGRMFAFEHAAITPDAVALAKSLGGGLVPVGALVARDEVFAKAYGTLATCLDHKTTFGGGPLAMAAVLGTLQVIAEEGLVGNAREMGGILSRRLRDLAARHPQIQDVRGEGLMLGIRFEGFAKGALDRTLLRRLGSATAELYAQTVALRLMEEHAIVTQVAANDLSVLKVMPPLSVDRAAIDRFIGALDAVLSDGGHAAAALRMAKELVRHRSPRE